MSQTEQKDLRAILLEAAEAYDNGDLERAEEYLCGALSHVRQRKVGE